MTRLLSGDLPRSRVLTVILLAMLLALACAPFLFPGARALNMAAKICIFVVLVASYDLLLGYTGIVSFAHTMFFGIGGYGVAIAMSRLEPGWGALALGTLGALLVSMLLAFLIGLFSLRVRAIFFAMITLAVATAFATLVSQLSEWTGGEDGISFKVPEVFTPGFSLGDAEWLGVPLNGKLFSYYFVFASALLLFLLLLRVVNSPFGRVLQAIRENDFRAEAIGYRTVVYRTVSTVLSAGFATLAGVLMALWLRYNGPDTSLSFEIMVDILLIVVIGGMGTLYGALIGTTLFLVAQTYLQDVMKLASDATAAIPLLSGLLHPDRWLLWLGLLFILSVYYFPQGIVGRLRGDRSEHEVAS
ncbi:MULTISPECIES: branched-chain amino acid ABC transporter permease [unclassified Cupriavidus]|uniref:branched-chain amino acid ABC transporter permease n=1 Tax=Cupriavidus TaxID=106589 RepID=UPI002270EEFA|nr:MULTISPECIES: branched-chain amino acid ABC transporter permease [unclassified Cupriavidus]MCY0855584.1 branched-chain amino acid ABC transporter permease [Cupriavidus sp. D39]MDW3686881.1 branched-chain amino acid ABC transporter permease [Cupriavidus sp. CV2]